MAWALRFDGVNDYADIASPIDLTADFNIEFILNLSSSRNDGFMELSTSTNNFFGKLSNNTVFCRLGGQTLSYSGGASVGGSGVKFKWVRVGSTLTAYLNDVQVAQSSSFTGGSTLNRIGRLQGGSNLDGQLLLISGTDSNGVSFNLDATASSHTAGTPILTDTIGGNNATGVNMPTDGSAWIDLGGGGGFQAAWAIHANQLIW